LVEALTPRNDEAERAVVGGVLVSPELLPQVRERVTPYDFCDAELRSIFGAICTLDEKREPVDVLAVVKTLGPERTDAIGGPTTVSRTMDGIPRLSNVAFYADLVRQASERRRAMVAADEYLHQLGKGHDAVGATQRLTESLRRTFQREVDEAPPLDEVLKQYLDDLEGRSTGNIRRDWLGTGIEALDKLVGGWNPGDLIVIGARPSIGKTAFALTTARHRAESGGVLFFETEMPAKALGERLLASEARLDLQLLRLAEADSGPSEAQWGRLAEAFTRLRQLDLVIEDRPSVDMAFIRSRVALEKERRRREGLAPLRDVVIDYLQLMEYRGRDLREGLTHIARESKMLAREEGVAVLLLSQLRRPESRVMPPPPPHVHELKETAAIEESADLVLLLDRPEFYLRAAGQEVGEHAAVGWISVAKHRQGPTGRVKAGFRPDSCTWADVWWTPQSFHSAGSAS
jgi:replicative DNA helicase